MIKIKGSDLDWVIEATEGKEVLLVSPEKSQTTTEVPKKISRDLVVAFLDRKLAVKGMQGIASVVRTKGHFPEGPGNNLVYDEERGNARRLLPKKFGPFKASLRSISATFALLIHGPVGMFKLRQRGWPCTRRAPMPTSNVPGKESR